MKYMGSKSRIAKYIVPIIQREIDDNHIKIYIEPFCGGCNIIDKIECNYKYAYDKQKYLIALLKNIVKIKDLPDIITKEHYNDVRECFNKKNSKYEDWYIGAIGFLSSYNGRFFDGGYSGIIHTKIGITRNYYKEAKNNLLEQMSNLKNIHFNCKSYNELDDKIHNCLIYCDPPYQGTKQYGSSKDFNHNDFWNWCRKMSEQNIVLISEHNAPQDFECIWSAPIKRTIDNTKRVDTVEKLFKIKEV